MGLGRLGGLGGEDGWVDAKGRGWQLGRGVLLEGNDTTGMHLSCGRAAKVCFFTGRPRLIERSNRQAEVGITAGRRRVGRLGTIKFGSIGARIRVNQRQPKPINHMA